MCGNDERDTHYYITRGRAKAKKEKQEDACKGKIRHPL